MDVGTGRDGDGDISALWIVAPEIEAFDGNGGETLIWLVVEMMRTTRIESICTIIDFPVSSLLINQDPLCR